jgi:hypothetical protein
VGTATTGCTCTVTPMAVAGTLYAVEGQAAGDTQGTDWTWALLLPSLIHSLISDDHLSVHHTVDHLCPGTRLCVGHASKCMGPLARDSYAFCSLHAPSCRPVCAQRSGSRGVHFSCGAADCSLWSTLPHDDCLCMALSVSGPSAVGGGQI